MIRFLAEMEWEEQDQVNEDSESNNENSSDDSGSENDDDIDNDEPQADRVSKTSQNVVFRLNPN